MRLQLALNVDDLGEAIDFYSKMFDVTPYKVRDGYANFAIEQPPLKLVLFEGAGEAGSINHLGVEVETAEQVLQRGLVAARSPAPLAKLYARRLLERGVRFVQLYHRGWDHHGDLVPLLFALPALCALPLVRSAAPQDEPEMDLAAMMAAANPTARLSCVPQSRRLSRSWPRWSVPSSAQAPAMRAVAHEVPTLPSSPSEESESTTATVSDSATRSGLHRPSAVGPVPVPRHMVRFLWTPPAEITRSTGSKAATPPMGKP